jgi:hypothetical protein
MIPRRLRAELVLCHGWRGVSAFAARTLRKIREGDPLAPARTLVLVPTAAAAHLVRRVLDDALLSRRSAAVLPKITTPSRLVEELSDRLADPLLREALLERAFERAEKAGAPAPFVVRRGLAGRVLELYDTLRLRSTPSSDETFFARILEELDAPDDEGARKLAEQTRFLDVSLSDYRKSLDDLGLVDPPRARALLREKPFPFERALVLGSETLEPLDLDFLAGAPGLESLTLAVSESSAELSDWLLRRFEDVRTFEKERDAPPEVLRPDDLTFLARDREEALLDVARLLKLLEDDGRLPPLHRVAVVVPRPLPYLYVAKKVFGEAGVPYQLEDTFPLAAEPYVAAVDVALELVATGFLRTEALALLRSPFFAFEGVGPAEVAAFDELTQRYREPGGISEWRSLLERLSRPKLQPTLPGIESSEPFGRALSPLRALIRSSEALAPLGDAGTLTDKVSCLRRFLSQHEAPLPDPDDGSRIDRARKALDDILERLAIAARHVSDPVIDFSAFRDKLRRAIESKTFALPTGDSGVAVVDARSAPFGSFDLVVLLGLNDGEWPARAERNIFYPQWLLSDFGWPSDRELLAAERRRFEGLLDLAWKHVALFRHQLEDEIPTVASPLLEDVPARMKADGFSESKPLAIDQVVVTRADAARLKLLEGRSLSRRAGRIEGPLAVPEPVSPTAFELYLRCPFKYFSRYLVGLEEEENVDETLTPLERGRILHELLQEGFAEWDRGRETPREIDPGSYDEALALFRRVALSKLPPPHRRVEMVRLFGGAGEGGAIPWLLRREMSRAPSRMRLMEYAFQTPLKLDRGPRKEEPENPWYVRIKGRVDRADVDRDGYLHVFDYKSGRAPGDDVSLQVPLYAMCLSQELSAPVREATYLSFRDRKATSRADFDKAARLLVDAYGKIQEGNFSPRPHPEHLCQSCGFVGVCRKEIEEVSS